MGQAAIGSCLGALSAGCLSNLLSRDCGDFRTAPKWIPPIFDSFFITAPLAATAVFPNPQTLFPIFLLWYIGTISMIWILTATCMLSIDKTHFGIKFTLPILVAGTATIIASWYTLALTPSVVVPLLLPVGIVVGTSLSDFGINLTIFILQNLEKIQTRDILYLIFRGLIAVACVLSIGYTLTTMLPDWGYMLCGFVLVFLSIFDPDRTQKASIVSAATTLGGIVMANMYPLYITLCIATVYNNFILHNPDISSDWKDLPLLPLLDEDDDSNELARSKTLLNLCIISGSVYVILSQSFLDITCQNSGWFMFSALITSSWILVAPRLLPHRF